jgi:hypothetical protein
VGRIDRDHVLGDPNGNCMEIKTMKNPNTLFKK